MAHFDFLNEEGLIPRSDIEYLYLFDKVWVKGELGSQIIKYGTVVTNVSISNSENYFGGYDFKIPGKDDLIYHCNYPWAFAENTPENLMRIKKYQDKLKEFEELKDVCDTLRKNIITLQKKPTI